jgi:2'-5' RNA ligase
MAGRFGKYGDLKRRQALQRGQSEKIKLERTNPAFLRRRSSRPPCAQKSLPGHAAKTYKTAVVAIPPEHLWGPIQGLRKQYDRNYRRWMPHITLLYPFRPESAFAQVTPLLTTACRSLEPFEVQLARFDYFAHVRRNATVYLVPEPARALNALHKALLDIAPDCDDAVRFPGGFTPHLSVGQIRSEKAQAFCTAWQATWQPLSFTLTHICLIWRNDPPHDVFRMGPKLLLGGQQADPEGTADKK